MQKSVKDGGYKYCIRYHRIFFALIGLIPLLGIVNWIAISLLVIGLIFGIIGICGKKRSGSATLEV